MDFTGSFKSPDILTPAIIPVTAGKNTANTVQKGKAVSGGEESIWGSTPGREPPKTNDSSEIAIAAIIKYCALIARLAEVSAKIPTKTVTIKAT